MREGAAARVAIDELSLVLPAYNEAAGIERVLDEARDELAARCRRFEIVVVDDGSTDASPRLLAAAAERLPELRVLTQPRNLGYAAALARGLGAARFDPVLYTDADGQFDLADLDRAMPLLTAGADMVAGYRAERADPWLRRFASGGFNLLVRALIGVRARDVDCAFKIFRRSFLEQVPIESDGFLVDTEIYARAARARQVVRQLPVRHRPRLAGQSTVRPGAIWRSFRGLLALRRALRAEDRAARREPAADPADTEPPAARISPGWRALATGPLLALVLGLYAQGGRALFEPDEGRTAQVAVNMIESGDWLVPRLRGEPYLDKPPVTYWLVAGGIELAGRSELAARLAHGLAFAGATTAVAWLGAMLWGGPAGRWAGIAYALTLGPFVAANILTPDAPLTLVAAWLLALVWRADHDGHTGHWILVGIAAAAGLMVKGAALPVVVAPLFLALCWRHRGVRWLAAPGPWIAAAVAAGLGLSWYVWVARRLPGAFDYFVANQITGRLVGDELDRNAQWSKVITLYGPVLVAGSLPWTFVGLRRLALDGRRAVARLADRSPESVYVGLSFLVPVVVFSLASSRMPLYLLPVFAPVALLAGRGLAERAAAGGAAATRRIAGWLIVWALALVALKTASTLTTQPRRDGRVKATLVEAARGGRDLPVLVVDTDLDALHFYGIADVRWATTRSDPYPVYRTSPPLEQALDGFSPPQLVVATSPSRVGTVLAITAARDYRCADRAGGERLALLACRSSAHDSPAPGEAAGEPTAPVSETPPS